MRHTEPARTRAGPPAGPGPRDPLPGATPPTDQEAEAVCIVSLFCVKKNTKNQKQMFIFYISLTLYKLFNNCQVESKGVFLDSCYFCNVSMRCGRRVAGKGVVFSPNCLFPEVVPFRQFL